jgi:hypothetical protein
MTGIRATKIEKTDKAIRVTLENDAVLESKTAIQWGQKATPLLIKRSSPGIFNLRQLAPVEIIAVLLSRTASFSNNQ